MQSNRIEIDTKKKLTWFTATGFTATGFTGCATAFARFDCVSVRLDSIDALISVCVCVRTRADE